MKDEGVMMRTQTLPNVSCPPAFTQTPRPEGMTGREWLLISAERREKWRGEMKVFLRNVEEWRKQ